jgi:hypothetical protein
MVYICKDFHMTLERYGTTVALGADWLHRYIGITPQLTEDEARAMVWAEIIKPEVSIAQIDRPEPACSLITVELDPRYNSREKRTELAQDVAREIATALRYARNCEVRQLLLPVGMEGRNSTPFNPKYNSASYQGPDIIRCPGSFPE